MVTKSPFQLVLDSVLALPRKRLTRWTLRYRESVLSPWEYCAIGAYAYRNGQRDMCLEDTIPTLVRIGISTENDLFEGTPEERWAYMVKWLEEKVSSCL